MMFNAPVFMFAAARQLRRLGWASVWLASSSMTPVAQAGPLLSFATEDYPPYHMQQGAEVGGFVTDKAREMLARAGVEGRFAVMPWQRAYLSARTQPNHCVYSTTRTPEREHLFKWVGPLARSDWTLYGLAGRLRPLDSLEAARPYRIGSYNGDVRDSYLSGRGFRVEAALDDQLNPYKLLNHRIDLWVSDRLTADGLIRQHGWGGRIVPLHVFMHVDLFLACHRDTPDAVVERLRRALKGMIKDGTAARIERDYEGWPSR